MTNKIFILLFSLLCIFCYQTQSQHRKVAEHGFRKTETRVVDHNDSDNSRKTLEKFNRRGKVTESWEWNYEGVLKEHIVYQYEGRKMISKVFKSNDSLALIETVEYDKKGREIKKTVNDNVNGKYEETVIEFDKWGNKIKEVITKNNQVIKVREFFYNKEGLLVRQITKNGEGKITYEKYLQYSK